MNSVYVEVVNGLVELHFGRLKDGTDGILGRLINVGFHAEATPSIGTPIYWFTNDRRRASEMTRRLRMSKYESTIRK